MKFKALIDGVHYDPKKGLVKIQFIANRVSLDELTTLSSKDESIHVTLESEQTKIGVFTPNAIIDEEAAERLQEAADQLREVDVDGDEVEESSITPEITEFPTEEADPDDVPDDEGDEVEVDDKAV